MMKVIKVTLTTVILMKTLSNAVDLMIRLTVRPSDRDLPPVASCG